MAGAPSAREPSAGGGGTGEGVSTGANGALPSTAGSATPLPTAVDGPLDRETIQRVMRTRSRAMRTCYEKALASDPKLRGRVDFTFTVTPAGTVGQASVRKSTLPEAPTACMLEAIRATRFPRSQGDAVTINYPFNFESDAP